jgi:hypothetical protein
MNQANDFHYHHESHCLHSSVEGHLGSFQLLAIINKAAMKIVEHVSFLLHMYLVFISYLGK